MTTNVIIVLPKYGDCDVIYDQVLFLEVMVDAILKVNKVPRYLYMEMHSMVYSLSVSTSLQ